MKGVLKVNVETEKIIMDRTFAKRAYIVGTYEYNSLQSCRRDYPGYEVVLRTIKRNPAKESYAGLTYRYMEDYILTHEPIETRKMVLDEFDEMLLISRCHSKAFRYPTIKKWFLDKYPEILNFGMPNEKECSNIESPLFPKNDENAAA